jgi:hypothetical protein
MAPAGPRPDAIILGAAGDSARSRMLTPDMQEMNSE